MQRTTAADDDIKGALVDAVTRAEGWTEGPSQLLDLVRAAAALGATEQLRGMKSMVQHFATGRQATTGSMPPAEIRALCEAWAVIDSV